MWLYARESQDGNTVWELGEGEEGDSPQEAEEREREEEDPFDQSKRKWKRRLLPLRSSLKEPSNSISPIIDSSPLFPPNHRQIRFPLLALSSCAVGDHRLKRTVVRTTFASDGGGGA